VPKVHDIGKWRVAIYPNDHRPAHVHVIGGGGEAVFILNCPGGPPRLRESFGFKKPALVRIENELAEVLTHLCAKWSEQHGGD
jgi:hypothetical protein